MICSIPEVGCSSRILSIRRAAATTSSMVRQPSFWTSAASGRSRAPRKASTVCLSAASSSSECKHLASFSASPASSIISFEPLLSCFREAHVSSRTEPAPKRDSSDLAASQVASSSRPARMLEPVAPVSSWHQVILALSVLTSPSWNPCSNSANQSDSTCCLWSYFPMWLTMEFIVGILLYDSDSKFFLFLFRTAFYFFFFNFLFRTAFYFLIFNILFRTAFQFLLFSLLFFSELLFTFYFLELLYFFSFTYVLFLVSTRTSNPPPLPPFVSEALFYLCRGTNIYNSFGVCPNFKTRTTAFYTF